MAVAAASTIGANPYLNPSQPGFVPALEGIGREEGQGLPEAVPDVPVHSSPAIDLRSAVSLIEEINQTLRAKPHWLALRVHCPQSPSLLGPNYA